MENSGIVAAAIVVIILSVISSLFYNQRQKDFALELKKYAELLEQHQIELASTRSSLENYKRVTSELKLRGDLYKKGIMNIITYAEGKKLVGGTKKIASFAQEAREQVKLQVKG